MSDTPKRWPQDYATGFPVTEVPASGVVMVTDPVAGAVPVPAKLLATAAELAALQRSIAAAIADAVEIRTRDMAQRLLTLERREGGTLPVIVTGSIEGAVVTQGVAASFVVAWAGLTAVWACLEKAGVQEGARVQLTQAGQVSLTPATAGADYRGALYTAETGGERIARSAASTAVAQGSTGGGTTPTPVTLPEFNLTPAARTITTDVTQNMALTSFGVTFPAGTVVDFSGIAKDGRVLKTSSGLITGLTAFGAMAETSITLSASHADDPRPPRTAVFKLTVQAVEVTAPDPSARTAAKLSDFPMMGYGAPIGSVATVGTPLVMGDLRDSEMLELRRNGVAIPSQFDMIDNPASDGSRRYARAHIPLPAVIPNGTVETWELWRKPKVAAPAPLDFLAKIAAHTCAVKFTNGSNAATINILDPALFSSGVRWVSGPYGVEARIRIPIPTAAVGGGADPELWVDVLPHSDDTLYVDVSVHNDLCFMPRSQGSIAYRMEMTANGQKLLDENVTLHEHKKRFTRDRRFNRAGVLVPRPATLRPDLDYWSRSGATAYYDRPLGVSASVLTAQAAAMAESWWSVPFNNRKLKLQMTGPGGDPGIGELPQSAVTALMYGTRETLDYAMGQSEAYDGLNMHFWDAERNELVNCVNRPEARCNTGYLQPADKLYHSGDATGWDIDEAHWADTGMAPYLLTGRRSRLDQINAMATFFAMKSAPADFERGQFWDKVSIAQTEEGALARIAYWRDVGYHGMDYQNGNQARGYGWGKKQIIEAWMLTPKAEQPRGPFFDLAMIADARAQRLRYDYVKDAQGSSLAGWPANASYGNNRHQAPWQWMFILQHRIRACYMGAPDAKAQFDHLFNTLSTLALDSVARDGSLYSGLNVGVYNLLVTKADYGTVDYGNPEHLVREPKGMIDTTSGQHFFTSTGAGDFPYTDPNNGMVSQNSGSDYHARWISILSQVYDLCAYKGWDTTRVMQCQAAAALWTQEQLFLTDINLKQGDNGPQISIVMRGTSRLNGGTRGQVAPGAALPPVYPIPFQEPQPVLGGSGGGGPVGTRPAGVADQAFTASRSLSTDDLVGIIAYTGDAPTSGTVKAPFDGTFEVRSGNQLYPKSGLSGQTAGDKSVVLTLSNATGTSEEFTVTVTVTTAATVSPKNIYNIPDADILEGFSFNRRLSTDFAADAVIVRLQQDAEPTYAVGMTNGLASRQAYQAAGAGKFVGRAVWVAGQIHGLHAVQPYDQALFVFDDEVLTSDLPGFVAGRSKGDGSGLIIPNVTINSPALGGAGLFTSEFTSDSNQRLLSFIPSGRSNDYDDPRGAALLGVSNRLLSERVNPAGAYTRLEGGTFTERTPFFAGGGYNANGANHLNMNGAVVNGPGGFTTAFGAGTIYVMSRGAGGDDAVAGQVVEKVVLRNPTQANVAAIRASILAFYGA